MATRCGRPISSESGMSVGADLPDRSFIGRGSLGLLDELRLGLSGSR